MAIYSINDLEKLCGIKAHTLRIWEKRYNIIEPKRTETNIRYYLDDDLQKVLNIAFLNRNGYKISKIAKLSDEEILSTVAQHTEVDATLDDKMDALIFAMLELNEFKFNKLLDHTIDEKGFEATMNDLIYPFMDKLSMMWMAGSIKGVHENFVASVIRRKTIIAIDQFANTYDPNAPKFILFLPEGESHELSLLFLHFLLKKLGVNVVNLGSHVSIVDVLEGEKVCNADFIFTLFNNSFSETPLQPYINELSRHSDCQILISGYQTVAQSIKETHNVKILAGMSDVKRYAQKVVSTK